MYAAVQQLTEQELRSPFVRYSTELLLQEGDACGEPERVVVQLIVRILERSVLDQLEKAFAAI